MGYNNKYPEEVNVIRRSQKSARGRIALLYPNKYSVGMASLTIKLLYSFFNQYPELICERVFVDETARVPPRSVETGKYLNSFDIIVCSISFELDIINYIKAISRSGIPVLTTDRKKEHPLFLVGGVAFSSNPFPYSPFFEVGYFGEIEPSINALLNAFSNETKKLRYEALLKVPGVLLLSEPIKEFPLQRVANLDELPTPAAQVQPITYSNHRDVHSSFSSGYMLELTRGCSRRCTFCLIGNVFHPMRKRSYENLIEVTQLGVAANPKRHVAVIGSAASDHPQLVDYLHYLNDQSIKFSVPSIRMDGNIKILDEIIRSGHRSVTVAPECASDELRSYLGKNFTNREVLNFARDAKKANIRRLKLYFMFGFSNDIDLEYSSLLKLIKLLNEWFRKPNLQITLYPFIPKRNTPLKSHIPDYRIVQRKIKQASSQLKKLCRAHTGHAQWAAVQAIISLGTPEIAPILIKVAQQGGSLSVWRKVLNDYPSQFLLDEFRKSET